MSPPHRTERILVVDGDTVARTAVCRELATGWAEVAGAGDAAEAIHACEAVGPALVLADERQLTGEDGERLLRRLRALEDAPALIVMVGSGDEVGGIAAVRSGASHYLTRPLDPDTLRVVAACALEARAVQAEARRLHQRLHDRSPFPRMVGTSPAMSRVFEIVRQVAPSKATVLITGESGTGKELVASALHERSGRAGKPFVKVHCAALAETLLESELFGHEKGSFTGAIERHEGRFQAADGGTLFLDEIGEISPAVQVKLLRFLQEHELERVGSGQTVHVDVRVIAATNRDLAAEVARGRFREDLFYRLNVVTIEMPPLRARTSDIPALAQFFLERFARDNQRPARAMAPATIELLAAHPWPGNVRELENAIEHAVVMAPGEVIEPRHLPAVLRAHLADEHAPPRVPGSTLAELERYAILKTMLATGGSTTRAAHILGISVRTIQYRLREYSEAPRSPVAAIGRTRAPARGG